VDRAGQGGEGKFKLDDMNVGKSAIYKSATKRIVVGTAICD
jgi:hypothetical protein